MSNSGRILLLDFCNYEDYPIGGYLSFAKNMIQSFGPEIALVGITTNNNDPVGKWFRKRINGEEFDFFSIARYSTSKTKHLIPDRLISWVLIKVFRRRIFKIGIRNIFIQRQEILLALTGIDRMNICYCFAGLENPLSISKYQYARHISRLFEGIFFAKLRFAKSILASGDDTAIYEMVERSRGKVMPEQIKKFPTRVNTDIFRIIDKDTARGFLCLPTSTKIIVNTGRLAPLKGWKFMVDCFIGFERQIPDSLFYLIGDGEDYKEIKQYISDNNLNEKIILTGNRNLHEIALFLNAADLFVMGSYKEGWSTSLMEAIACGLPVCTTDFSSAKDIVLSGVNGFVIDNRNPQKFINCMTQAIMFPRPVPNEHVTRYSVEKMKDDMLLLWALS
jgi:glycosyltransferase involved in cell wall biosynthesis